MIINRFTQTIHDPLGLITYSASMRGRGTACHTPHHTLLFHHSAITLACRPRTLLSSRSDASRNLETVLCVDGKLSVSWAWKALLSMQFLCLLKRVCIPVPLGSFSCLRVMARRHVLKLMIVDFMYGCVAATLLWCASYPMPCPPPALQPIPGDAFHPAPPHRPAASKGMQVGMSLSLSQKHWLWRGHYAQMPTLELLGLESALDWPQSHQPQSHQQWAWE